MHFTTPLLTLLCAATMTNAVVVDLFSDENCGTPAGNRNVFDNSCALLGGFGSFKITTPGGSLQQLTAYSRNACAGKVTACVDVGNVGSCYRATNGDGGSNAMSSSPVCGTP